MNGGEYVKNEGNEIIVSNIRRIIDERGIKHCKVAEALGMTKSVFSGMLCGRKVLQASYLPLIVRANGCTYEDLFRRPEENPT